MLADSAILIFGLVFVVVPAAVAELAGWVILRIGRR